MKSKARGYAIVVLVSLFIIAFFGAIGLGVGSFFREPTLGVVVGGAVGVVAGIVALLCGRYYWQDILSSIIGG